MSSILLNPITKTLTTAYLNAPSHGLLIAGPNGSGKTYLAEHIASGLLGVDQKKLHSYPYFFTIKPDLDKNQISIEQVRRIKQLLSLKTIGSSKIKRIILIEQAELMGHEAQNASLKLLEEPNSDTVVILTASQVSYLLPTISSRLQKITIHPVGLAMASHFFSSDKSEIERAWCLSQGYAGLMHGLLNSVEDHELNIALHDARQLLAAAPFERLLQVQAYSSDKIRLQLMLTAMDRLLSASHFNAIGKNDGRQISNILRARRNLVKVQASLANNGSSKLNLLYLFTSFS